MDRLSCSTTLNTSRACRMIAFGSFFNAGQVCSATERVIASKKIHRELAKGLSDEAQKCNMGDPLAPATTMGPLNNHAVAEKTDQHISDSVEKGATILCGGSRARELAVGSSISRQ